MPTPLIELRAVSKTYKLGDELVHALESVDLSINQGDFIAVVGPSGSGKSTLATIIGGLDRPDAGTISVEGRELVKLNDRDLSEYRNKKIGFVFQNFNLQPNYTAAENVAVPLLFARMAPKERQKRAEECLRAVGLSDRLNHRPTQLSGGQRQRVAIARALANQPEIIIADEPTGNLDSKKGEEVIDLLKKLNKELHVTLLVITHDANVAKQADRVLNIQDGHLK